MPRDNRTTYVEASQVRADSLEEQVDAYGLQRKNTVNPRTGNAVRNGLSIIQEVENELVSSLVRTSLGKQISSQDDDVQPQN